MGVAKAHATTTGTQFLKRLDKQASPALPAAPVKPDLSGTPWRRPLVLKHLAQRVGEVGLAMMASYDLDKQTAEAGHEVVGGLLERKRVGLYRGQKVPPITQSSNDQSSQ